MYVVHCSGLTVDKEIITKTLEGLKNFECYVSKKIQETNIRFSSWSFFLAFFLCFFCIHYFSFSLLTIIWETKRQSTRIKTASNIDKIINMSHLLHLATFIVTKLKLLCGDAHWQWIRINKRQRTRINKASNIDKITNMSSWGNQDKRPYWIFREII